MVLFLDVPPEVRSNVYTALFRGRLLRHRKSSDTEEQLNCLSIFYASKQIYAESRPVLYDIATFSMKDIADGYHNFYYNFDVDMSLLKHISIRDRPCEAPRGRILSDMSNLATVTCVSDYSCFGQKAVHAGMLSNETITEMSTDDTILAEETSLLPSIAEDEIGGGPSIMKMWEISGRSFKLLQSIKISSQETFTATIDYGTAQMVLVNDDDPSKTQTVKVETLVKLAENNTAVLKAWCSMDLLRIYCRSFVDKQLDNLDLECTKSADCVHQPTIYWPGQREDWHEDYYPLKESYLDDREWSGH